jgi:hypothetical protein
MQESACCKVQGRFAMLAASIVLMVSCAGMALYARMLAVVAKPVTLDRFGSFKKLHHSQKCARIIHRSVEIRRRRARTIVEVKPNTTLNHAERTVI